MISKKYSLLFFMLCASLIECGLFRMNNSVFKTKIFTSEGKCYLNNSTFIAERATFAHLEAQDKVYVEIEEELELDNALVGTLIIRKAKKIHINNSIIDIIVLEDNAADPILHNCDVRDIIDKRKIDQKTD